MSEQNEESFIILGDTSSLFDSYSLLQVADTNGQTSLAAGDTENGTKEPTDPVDSNNKENTKPNHSSVNSSSSLKKNSLEPSLAEEFLLGAIDCETMKVRASLNPYSKSKSSSPFCFHRSQAYSAISRASSRRKRSRKTSKSFNRWYRITLS